ncbi:hypothetical protein [Lacticaseibacillus hulanensis]|uniref:hypothetical protein n=1 Tax=Lacticaseibacillus hulanensis TaxID=2493111 RepID=UPI000FDCBE8F|nr:hypothetical protein [Lacticaseibacillus hulanensis]
MKRFMTVVMGLGVMLTLTACGNKLTTTKTTYKQDGLVAVIKGDATGADKVQYSSVATDGSVKVNGGTYAITIPVTDKKQTVHLTAGKQKQTVTVNAAKTLGTYKNVATKYNQAVIGSALPKSVQKQMQAKQPTKAQIAQMAPAAQMAMATKAKQMQAELAKATKATKDKQLDATAKAGIHEVLNTKNAVVRANVADGKAVGFALIVPVKAMKDKTKAKDFATTLALLGNATGANAKDVMKKFQKAVKDQNDSKTTIDTIKSNGVKFNVGVSTSHLYIYITK